MFRFKLTAVLLSLLARLGLSEPQYSILDESSSKWLPDDTLLTGLNTLYNSLFQSVKNDDDKKKRPVSAIAAAIVDYLSTDLADEQSKLNSALNTRRITTKSLKAHDIASTEKTNDEKLPKTSDFLDKLLVQVIKGNNTDVKKDNDNDFKADEVIDNKVTNIIDNDNQERFSNYYKRLSRLPEQFLENIIHL